MLTYRTATLKDAAAIAAIHARNWQDNYRGAFSDQYLDEQVEAERVQVWTQRLEQSTDNQHIIVAEEAQQLVGFTCLKGESDPIYGTLLDNLHVAAGQKGRGLGGILLQKSIDWSFTNYPQRPMYLWVLCQNESGIRFYERKGGQRAERKMDKSPTGLEVAVYRYVWRNITSM